MFNSPFVYYLETNDFDPATGALFPNVSPVSGLAVFKGKVIVMAQGNFCHYCTQFKPIFAHVASLTPHIDFATIQTDSESPAEQFSPSMLNRILGRDLQGVPTVVKFQSGRPVDVFEGPRTKEALMQWI